MTAPARSASRPRDRIIDAARDLFRKYGIRGIGVDAIAEAADSNKMTLYRHFGSKDDLIVACLEKAAAEAEAFWDALEAAHPGDPRAQLKDWVRRAADYVTVEHGNCELIDAAAQLVESNHPARYMIEETRRAHRRRLIELCRDAGIVEAELLVDALTLLVEGARVNWRSAGPEGPSTRFVRAAEMMIESFATQHSAAKSGDKERRARAYAEESV
jgi:AcrR family transcriptional regulator